jgi:catechol 2,3-dioxygenase-like lactoylglutathione lyase family enzyme
MGGRAVETEAITMRATKTFGSFAVDDIDAARSFYRDTLGLRVSDQAQDGPIWLHGSEGHDTLVYPKPEHVPATFTVLNLFVEDIDETVDELNTKGITPERYDSIDTDDRGIYRSEGHSVAWLTDPAGNVIAIGQRH